MEVVRSGRVDLEPLLTHRFALADIAEAYDLFAARREGVLEGRHHVPDAVGRLGFFSTVRNATVRARERSGVGRFRNALIGLGTLVVLTAFGTLGYMRLEGFRFGEARLHDGDGAVDGRVAAAAARAERAGADDRARRARARRRAVHGRAGHAAGHRGRVSRALREATDGTDHRRDAGTRHRLQLRPDGPHGVPRARGEADAVRGRRARRSDASGGPRTSAARSCWATPPTRTRSGAPASCGPPRS